MYISTRGMTQEYSAAQAIKTGIAADGGLFVPSSIPRINEKVLDELVQLGYSQRAVKILQYFLDDYSEREILDSVQAAYNFERFDSPDIAPIAKIGNTPVLELWHGPTLAFKDMALQLLPQLLSRALVKTGEQDEMVILVATSGDTGKAALEGFRDVNQTKIIVFYPSQGVSEIQRLQMITQEGNNVKVIAVNGNFDDAQTGVKNIFNSSNFNNLLNRNGFRLSSANSINWGRLVPQIIYYFSAYAELVKNGDIAIGQNINFVVPTGNFGNILAGYYAKEMGLPVNKLVCASNSNNVLTDFLQTGLYDRNRTFNKTISPSMDILISSNLERLLFHISGGQPAVIQQWMNELNEKGRYQITSQCLDEIKTVFWAGWASDSQTLDAIKAIYSQYRYLADPHTAVAWKVYQSYAAETGDSIPTVIVSTASPFKFNESVLHAIGGINMAGACLDPFDALEALSKSSGWPVPDNLNDLHHKPIRHKIVCDKNHMERVVSELLEINRNKS